jgi:hypothetical protein
MPYFGGCFHLDGLMNCGSKDARFAISGLQLILNFGSSLTQLSHQ